MYYVGYLKFKKDILHLLTYVLLYIGIEFFTITKT